MSESPRRRLSPALGRVLRLTATLVVLGLCVWAASKLDLRGAAAVLGESHLGWVGLSMFINFPYALLQAWRWRCLLRPAGEVPLLSLFRYLIASRAASNLLPARAGELLRIYLPSARDKLPAVTVASTLVVERFFDAFGLAVTAAPLLLLLGMPAWIRTGLLILVAAGVGGLAASFVLALRGSRRGESILDRIARSTEALRDPRAALVLVGLTLVGWIVCEVGMVLACLAAVGLDPAPASAILVVLAVNLGMVFQVTPANVGPFEGTVILALAAVGIKGARALAAALVYHLTMVVPVTLAGLEGLRFIGEARRERAAAGALAGKEGSAAAGRDGAVVEVKGDEPGGGRQ